MITAFFITENYDDSLRLMHKARNICFPKAVGQFHCKVILDTFFESFNFSISSTCQKSTSSFDINKNQRRPVIKNAKRSRQHVFYVDSNTINRLDRQYKIT